MALRLKYAGVATEKTHIVRDYAALVEQGLEAAGPGGTFYIVANYTAMMDIRRLMRKKYGLKEFWE
jgi:23S rRNA G2069 N7-methylase RlmK/C1962 C5-methylase RlmI